MSEVTTPPCPTCGERFAATGDMMALLDALKAWRAQHAHHPHHFAAAVPEAPCCAYHASRGTEGALVACQPSPAVPEAQDGRPTPCLHCGRLPDADGDHTCPCPHTDATCRDHPVHFPGMGTRTACGSFGVAGSTSILSEDVTCPHCIEFTPSAAVREGERERLAGAKEAAAILDVSRQRLKQLTTAPGFPEPRARLAGGNIWAAADIEEFAATRNRKPGPAPSLAAPEGTEQ